MSGEEWSIREFRALHAAITQRSVTAAAAWLGVSQPAVSRTLAALEAKVGRALFIRAGRSIAPTDDALRLNEQLMPLFALLDELRVERGGRMSEQTLRIAVPPAFANGYIQGAIATFMQNHPAISVELDVRTSPVIVGEVADGTVELGLSDMRIESSPVRRMPVCLSAMACFMPRSHPLAAAEEITADMLRGEPIVALSRRHFARQQLDSRLTALGLERQVRFETSTTLSALAFARRRLGIAVMNPFPIALDLEPDLVAVKLIPEIRYTASFILPVEKPPRRLTAMFIKHLRATLPNRPWIERMK